MAPETESELISHLRSFNRKERNILLEDALGAGTFHLDTGFRERLGSLLGLIAPGDAARFLGLTTIPGDAFVAMDYHLDWLHVALHLVGAAEPVQVIPKPGGFSATQIDVDLLVVFGVGETTHVVLIEAKSGGGWNNMQLRKKAERLATIFGDTPNSGPISRHFVLLSPHRPQKLATDSWPDWMKPHGRPLWMELQLPPTLRTVTRSDEHGRASAAGTFLRIHPPL